MVQRLVQTQEQKLIQQQRLTQQQMLQVRLLEMPLAELEQSVQAEIDDNPALETTPSEDTDLSESSEPDTAESYEESIEREERADALDTALQNMGGDDEMPEPESNKYYTSSAELEEITYGDQRSFYDQLKEQMRETELTAHQQDIMEYLIGSLDSDGLLRKPLDTIADELAIFHSMDVSEKEVEEILTLLQGFDPAGIGARSLKECLLLQIERRPDTPIRRWMLEVITHYFKEFMNKQWSRINEHLNLSDELLNQVQTEILKLNPKPGSSMGETEGRNLQQITPDFVVDTNDDGTISFYINKGRVPDLYVSPSFSNLLKGYQENKQSMSRQDKQALLYAREKVERAKGYIDAVKQRRHTLYITMKTIIDLQRQFFLEGDENDLKPMVLKDIAERTGLDISTVSRVCNSKYAQTRWGIFRLRHFFSEGVKTESGEEMSTRKLKAVLHEMISSEDPKKPLNDDQLAREMKNQGYAIARRTVAKYREQLGIPIARFRKTN
jgi:RNA polymerase sigma-54 factor